MSAARKAEAPDVPHPRAASADLTLLLVVALVPLAVTFVLRAAGVPLGKPGTFTYLYSPDGIFERRVEQLPAALLIAGALAAGVWLLCDARRGRRRGGAAMVVSGLLAIGAWSLIAPPQWRSQVYFNLSSPSHDGAFLTEAAQLDALGVIEYLRAFPERAATPKHEMRGTRVISNPPAATLLAQLARRLAADSAATGALLDRILADEPPEVRADLRLREALVFAFLLHGLWMLSAAVLFCAAREVLDAPLATLLAIVATISPATLTFTPGKDPAQLLTAAALLWLALRAWRRSSPLTAVAAGVTAAIAALVGLIHVWLALVLLVAALAATPRAELGRFALRVLAPAAAGALAVVALLWLAWRIDAVAILRSVAAAQASVTRGPDAMPWTWQLLGIPLFALFAGPALWFLALRGGWPAAAPQAAPAGDAGARAQRFGRWLVGVSAVVMVATVAFTNVETPRLWMPFQPLLLLGLLLTWEPRSRARSDRAALLAAVVFLHVAASAAQWSLMDMRESENRLLESVEAPPRFFD